MNDLSKWSKNLGNISQVNDEFSLKYVIDSNINAVFFSCCSRRYTRRHLQRCKGSNCTTIWTQHLGTNERKTVTVGPIGVDDASALVPALKNNWATAEKSSTQLRIEFIKCSACLNIACVLMISSLIFPFSIQ